MADDPRDRLVNDEDDSTGGTISRQSQDDSLDRRESRYQIGSILILFMNILFLIGYSGWLIHSLIYQGNLVFPIVLFLHNLIGTLLLLNGLYGRFRGISLQIYVAVFEVMVIPAAFYSVIFFMFVFGYNKMKEAIQKILTEHDVKVQVEVAMIYLIVLCVAADVYHVIAAIVIRRYCKIRRQRDWYF